MPDFSPEELLPHRAPMLLVQGILEADLEHDSIVATARCSRNDLLYNSDINGVYPTASIEIMAQAIGLLSGYADRIHNRPAASMGKLLSVKQFHLHTDALPLDAELLAEARGIMNTPPIGVYECRLLHGKTLLAEAEITVIRED